MTVPPPGLVEGDFERIEAAVRETERGRWFLEEFASRIRTADAEEILNAISDLEARTAAREAAEQESGRHLEKLVSLVAMLVDHLNAQKERTTANASDSLDSRDEPALRLETLAKVDALSVPDKLKFFR